MFSLDRTAGPNEPCVMVIGCHYTKLGFFVAFFTLLAHSCITSNVFFWILDKFLSVVVSPSICSCIFGNFKPFSVVCNFLFHPGILKVHSVSKGQGILLAARMTEMICVHYLSLSFNCAILIVYQMRNLGNNFCLRSVDFWHNGFPPYYIQKLHYIHI